MNGGSKWRDLLIAAAIASVLELTPVNNAFYKYVYLPVFQGPPEGAMLAVVNAVGWCFYLLIVWLALQLISFLFGNPSNA